MKLSIIVPVYNEEQTIRKIIDKIQKVPVDKEIIIVNDCSTDGTKIILQSIKADNINIFHHDKNAGKGAAIRSGIEHVTGDITIIQDADLEYDPAEIPKVIKPILDGKADVVYGSRFLNKKKDLAISWQSKLANSILTFLTNLLFRTNLTDMETCYKAIKSSIIKSINIESNCFGFEPEITSKLSKKGIKIIEVPISFAARKWSEGKKISWKDGVKAIFLLLKYRLTN